ncbi:MAG: VTT domain-containing protein [Candidatus Paceibacterota bacterium]
MIRSTALRLFILAVVLIAALWIATSIGDYETLRAIILTWGYPALFVLAVVSGFSLIAPVPAVVFVPLVVAVGLNFWVAIIIVIIGMTIGDGFGIFLGSTGRQVFDEWIEVRWLERVEKFLNRWKLKPEFIAFLYAAFIPLPNELLFVPLAFLKKHTGKLFLAAFLGNAVFNIIAAGVLVGIVKLI